MPTVCLAVNLKEDIFDTAVEVEEERGKQRDGQCVDDVCRVHVATRQPSCWRVSKFSTLGEERKD